MFSRLAIFGGGHANLGQGRTRTHGYGEPGHDQNSANRIRGGDSAYSINDDSEGLGGVANAGAGAGAGAGDHSGTVSRTHTSSSLLSHARHASQSRSAQHSIINNNHHTSNGHARISSAHTVIMPSLGIHSPRSSASMEHPRRSDSPPMEDETVVDPDQGNILLHIISQLRPGADLSRVVLPTFILEPRSMLERITNFMAHPEMLLPIPEIEDPVERFVSVVKFYLSGWHIKPPGVKKPLNPVLGETFTGYWTYPDGTHGYYISEQTSHHPPKSSYFFMAPEHHIRVDGTLKPHSKFLGNSAASMMEGVACLSLLNHGVQGKGERYLLTQPNMYARGILIGKLKFELGDHSYVRCPENDLVADIEFKTKGWFSGGYNAIGGTIKNTKTGEILYEISGHWNAEMFIKDHATGTKECFFNASHSKHTPPTARPIDQQYPTESQRLWNPVIQALYDRNHDVATDEKTKIEESQREKAAKRVKDGVQWKPKLFRPVEGGPGNRDEGEEDLDWIIDATVDAENPEVAVKQILKIAPIMEGQAWDEEGRVSSPSPEVMQAPAKEQPETPLPKEKPQQKEAEGNLIDMSDDEHKNEPRQEPRPQSRPLSSMSKRSSSKPDSVRSGSDNSKDHHGHGHKHKEHGTSKLKKFPNMKDLIEPLKPEKHHHK